QCTSGLNGAGEEEENESENAQENENEDGGDACTAGTSPDGGLTSSVLGVVHITQVPEPGSLWLVLAALFVAAPLLARRKHLS
ncbi:MAG: PEP-CTERM sorting domain-containing protein, partial [Betaproteobacteria bacterium]|nr:PEP-CTERM sorting domain-containing protein [Betaproteobacteria bacterium]